MTDEQVIKAIECCTKKYGCHDCPLVNDELCMITINKEALSLIKWQQVEIEDLIKQRDEQLRINRQVVRRNGKHVDERNRLRAKLATAKSEAYKDFAEMLKKYKYVSSDWSHGEHHYVVEEDDIDNLLWVLTEGSNGE